MDLNAPERINDKALKLLEKRFTKLEPKFVKKIEEWIQKFRTSSGNIVRSKENLARLSSFKTAVERYLLQAGYNDMVSKYLEAFDQITEHEQSVHKELNGIKLTKSFMNPYKKWAVNNVIAQMQGNNLAQNIINPLRQEMFIAVNQGSSLNDVILSITGQLTTTNVRQGILKRQVLQASRDAILQYDGVVNEAVRKVYKLPALMYVGSIVKDSRPQCEKWVNYMDNGKKGVIMFDQLADEIDWAENNGTGMIPNTTPENFCQNRGGFNCRHICYPIRYKKPIEEEIKEEKVPEIKLGFDKKFDEFANSEEIKDEAKVLINKYPKPKNIRLSKNSSYYNPSTDVINMNENSKINTFYHEYAHYLDIKGTGATSIKESLSLKSEFKKAYDDDVLHLKQSFKGKNIFDELAKEWRDKPEFYGASDILDSLSGGVFYEKYRMAGHGKKYYKDKNLRHIENFANIFQAWSLKDKTSLDNIKKYYPNLFKEFENILKTL